MLVSIITPTFNHEKYIARCIESVIQQSFTDWELIIIDDGSIDGTRQIAESFAAKNSNIYYYYQENIGLYQLKETYNKALNYAKGEFIAILEGDDYWYPEKLNLQVKPLKESPDFVFSWSKVDVVNEDENIIGHYPIHAHPSKMGYYNNEHPASILNIFLEDFPVPLSWVIRTSTLRKIGGFQQTKEMPTIDMDTLYALSLEGRFKYISEATGAYRRSVNQATRKLTVEILKGSCQITKGFYLKLPEDYKKNIKYSYETLLEMCSKHISIAYSRYGRACLVRKEFKEARLSYIKSFEGKILSNPIWKVRSAIGLLFSIFHADVEGLAKILGKKSYK